MSVNGAGMAVAMVVSLRFGGMVQANRSQGVNGRRHFHRLSPAALLQGPHIPGAVGLGRFRATRSIG
jgi:hypothetical protein